MDQTNMGNLSKSRTSSKWFVSGKRSTGMIFLGTKGSQGNVLDVGLASDTKLAIVAFSSQPMKSRFWILQALRAVMALGWSPVLGGSTMATYELPQRFNRLSRVYSARPKKKTKKCF